MPRHETRSMECRRAKQLTMTLQMFEREKKKTQRRDRVDRCGNTAGCDWALKTAIGGAVSENMVGADLLRLCVVVV